jgi:hypothetical protein
MLLLADTGTPDPFDWWVVVAAVLLAVAMMVR